MMSAVGPFAPQPSYEPGSTKIRIQYEANQIMRCFDLYYLPDNLEFARHVAIMLMVHEEIPYVHQDSHVETSTSVLVTIP